MGYPLNKGVCNTCEDKKNCPMPFLLEKHKENIEKYGDDYDKERPDLWDEFAIEEPEVKGDEMVWCPMHFDG